MIIGFDIGNLSVSPWSGIGNYVSELIKELLRIDKKNRYILLGITPLKAYKELLNFKLEADKKIERKIYKMPSKLFHRIFSLWQKLGFPPVEYLTGNINIFHSFDWFCPASKKAKIVATIFDVTPLSHPEWHTKANIQQHSKRLLTIKKRADFITTISESSKKDIVKVLGIDPEKIIVAYPGIDRKRFYMIKNKLLIKNKLNKYGLEPGYLLFVGTLEPRKNIQRLIKAYNLLRLKKKLVLVGRPGKGIEKLTFAKNIIWLNYVSDEDLPFIYNGASLFIYPSLYEGFGMPVLEAMSSGVPVITSNVSSLPEVVGEAVILVEPKNIKALAGAMKKVTGNKFLSNELRKKGLERVKKFTWEKCAKTVISIYEKIASPDFDRDRNDKRRS